MAEYSVSSHVVSTGGTQEFILAFVGPSPGYLFKEDITLMINDVLQDGTPPNDATFTWDTDTTVTVAGYTTEVDDEITFLRTTEKTEMIVDFISGKSISSDNLDLDNLQLLYVVHEVLDGRELAEAEFVDNILQPYVTACEAAQAAAELAETNAEIAEAASEVNATNSAASEVAAGISETNSGNSESASAASATASENSAIASGVSETNSAASEVAAGISEVNAGDSASLAAAYMAASTAPITSYQRSNLWTIKGTDISVNRKIIVSPDAMYVKIGGWVGGVTANTEVQQDWLAGVDYYIYLCIPTPDTGTIADIVVSTNQTAPTGYTISNSLKVGGFHTFCADVGTYYTFNEVAPGTRSNPAHYSGFMVGDIMDTSMWDLQFRAACDNNDGLVYSAKEDIWAGIYYSSLEDDEAVSKANANILQATKWGQHVYYSGKGNKQLPSSTEFSNIAAGTPEGVVLGTSRHFTNLGIGLQNDLGGMIFTKNLNNTTPYEGRMIDTLQGAGKSILCTTVAAQQADTTVTAFTPTGIKEGANAWQTAEDDFTSWVIHNTNKTTTDGTHTWQYNLESGFAIVSYTGNGADRWIPSPMGKIIRHAWTKNLTDAQATLIYTDSTSLGAAKYVRLQGQYGITSNSQFFNGTQVSEYLKCGPAVNTTGKDYVLYCWFGDNLDTTTTGLRGILGKSAVIEVAHTTGTGSTVDLGVEPDYIYYKSLNDSTTIGNWYAYIVERGMLVHTWLGDDNAEGYTATPNLSLSGTSVTINSNLATDAYLIVAYKNDDDFKVLVKANSAYNSTPATEWRHINMNQSCVRANDGGVIMYTQGNAAIPIKLNALGVHHNSVALDCATAADQTDNGVDDIIDCTSRGFILGNSSRWSSVNQTMAVSFRTDKTVIKSCAYTGQQGKDIKWFYNETTGFAYCHYESSSGPMVIDHPFTETPRVMITKSLSGVYQWVVYLADLGTSYFYAWNSDAAKQATAGQFGAAPTDSTITIGNTTDVHNPSDTYLLMIWVGPVNKGRLGHTYFENYSHTTGTDSVINLGLTPNTIILKRDETAAAWQLYTAKLSSSWDTYKVLDAPLAIQVNGTPFTISGEELTIPAAWLTDDYVIMAFADDPLAEAGTANVETYYATGTNEVNGTGGSVTTEGDPILSDCGCWDCVGVIWQFLRDEANHTIGDAALDWYDPGNGRGQVYSKTHGIYPLVAGGQHELGAALVGTETRRHDLTLQAEYKYITSRVVAKAINK